MGRLTSSARRRRVLRVLALATLTIGAVATWALAAGPGGWDHLGDRGVAGTKSLNLVASALEVTPGALYVGGAFEDAGGIASADRIAKWDGSNWSAVSSSTSQFPANSRVDAIAVADGKVYAGGTFKNAGGKPDADHLAVWDGASWEPFCESVTSGPAFDDNVTSLQIIGSTLYVGGVFHNGGGDVDADYLLACDLGTGASSAATLPGHFFSGPVYALTADSNGTLYAGGRFGDLEDIPEADNVAYLPVGGTWQPMGGSAIRACDCAIDTFVRGLTAVGTDVYVGTDQIDIAHIPKADHVAKWNGSAWSALGANSAGDNGWFPTTTSINALTGVGQNLFVSGTFQDADGDPRADNVAWFNGTEWQPVGSDGAGNGPWIGNGLALALFGSRIYATGSFTSAGGDPQAQYAASFPLSYLIAVPTPTVTPGPGPVPTPTVTPSPTPPPDVTPPRTRLRAAVVSHAKRKATFRFASGEPGSKFLCKLDKKKYRPCTSPKTYKKLKRGKHVFRVKARDRAGNVDRTPIVKRFTIKRKR